jgi:hypothetical protein
MKFVPRKWWLVLIWQFWYVGNLRCISSCLFQFDSSGRWGAFLFWLCPGNSSMFSCGFNALQVINLWKVFLHYTGTSDNMCINNLRTGRLLIEILCMLPVERQEVYVACCCAIVKVVGHWRLSLEGWVCTKVSVWNLWSTSDTRRDFLSSSTVSCHQYFTAASYWLVYHLGPGQQACWWPQSCSFPLHSNNSMQHMYIYVCLWPFSAEGSVHSRVFPDIRKYWEKLPCC